MSIENKLKSSLSAVEDALRLLRSAKHNANPHGYSQIVKAIQDLESAKSDLERSIRDLRG